jgi:hypothetical protein
MKKSLPKVIQLCSIAAALFMVGINQLFAQHNPIFGAGNSYVNISKKTNGGFVQVGDTLEIRTNYYFGGSYNIANAKTLYSVRYYDSVPLNTTMLSGTADSLRLITNEGLTARKYTLTGNDDPGTYNQNPGVGKYQIRINIGSAPAIPNNSNYGVLTDNSGSSNVIIGTYRPLLFGGTLITTAFRVKATGNVGDTITLAAPKFIYRKTSSGADTVVTGTRYRILINGATQSTLCANALGSNLASEYKGTFDSGSVQNRVSGPIFPIPSYDYKPLSRTASTSDGSYTLVNNLSPTARTNFNARMQPNCANPTPIPAADSCAHRMHGGFWDIIGDHTGTTTAAGNPAQAPGMRAGYMLVVNADVVTSEAYRQSVTGLCPDTYYEFSAWLRNVCKRCGIDSNSVATYKAGVYPNLTFSIDGVDIYSTGQMDTTGWQKKGFVFKTNAGQTSAIISIRNNASGGGGNDWAIDDIAIGTCGPSMTLNYNPLLGCNNGVLVNLSDTIRYTYNPNYSWYKWERSTDGGLTWGPPPIPTTGTATPVLVGGLYQFVTNYPAFLAYAADSGHLYRVVVATSNANLSSATCSFTDNKSVLLNLISCPNVVDANFLSFTGSLNARGNAQLNWIVNNEQQLIKYEVEKSVDGTNYYSIGALPARNSINLVEYTFTDPDFLIKTKYYRLKIINVQQQFKYSKVIILSKQINFEVNGLLNPFSTSLQANIVLPYGGLVKMWLFDSYGKQVMKENKQLNVGLNSVTYWGLTNLSRGIYIIAFEYNNQVVQRKISKID